MTMADTLALVAGVALAFALITGLPKLPYWAVPSVDLASKLDRSLRGVCLTASVVAMARVWVYRRMPWASEWLAVLVGASLLIELPLLDIDFWVYAYGYVFPSLDPLSWTGKRWVVAGLFTVGFLASLGLFARVRTTSPAWVKTLLLTWLAILAMAGPLWVLSQHGADLISPSSGFGPGLLAIVWREALVLAARLPMGLLFGIPMLAALSERIARRPWTWVEWASASGSIVTGLAFLMTFRGDFTAPSLAWLAERVMVLGWIVVILLVSQKLIIHFDRAWQLFVLGPIDQEPSSPSEAESSAMVRST